jgi:membrane protein
VRESSDAAQIVAQEGESHDVSTRVCHIHPTARAAGEGKRASQRRLDRAAPVQRTTTIMDAREEFLLERVGDVGSTGELFSASDSAQQLERRLAVAILQVLAPQPPAVGGKQKLATRAGHERDRLAGIEQAKCRSTERSRARNRSFRALLSGRHASMSVQVARRPPSQFLRDGLGAVDRYQQRKRLLGFVVAVFKRFDDDQGSQMGALIAYYGFFSLFPLLLVFVTVLGFVLEGSPSTQASVLHSTLSQFPIIGTQLQSNVHSLKGSVPALALGIVGATLAGLGITGAAQSALNKVWHLPRARQLGFLAWRVRGVGLLIVFGLLTIISTVAAGYVTAQTTGIVGVIIGVVVALTANLVLFFAVFRLLTADEIPTRDLIAGVIVAAVLWQILQHVGGFYVERVVRHAKDTSGLFAFVLGLLTWLYLGGQVTLIAAEVNVVRAKRLWPRSLLGDSPDDTDS